MEKEEQEDEALDHDARPEHCAEGDGVHEEAARLIELYKVIHGR